MLAESPGAEREEQNSPLRTGQGGGRREVAAPPPAPRVGGHSPHTAQGPSALLRLPSAEECLLKV